MQKNIRIWTAVSVDEVQNKLLFIDDLYGSCGNCKQLGLNYIKDKVCPNCKTEFKYLATRLKNRADITKILARIQDEGLGFTLIDRDDFEEATAKDKFQDIFKTT